MLNINSFNTDKLNLYLNKYVGALLFHEYPTTIVYSDELDNPIVREWVEYSDETETDRYFYYNVEKIALKKFIEKGISHIELIRSAKNSILHFQDVSKDKKVIKNSVLGIDLLPNQYKPDPDFFPNEEDFVNANEIYAFFNLGSIEENSLEKIIEETKRISILNKSETLNIHLRESAGVGYGTIDSALLGGTLVTFDGLYRELALDHWIGVSRGEKLAAKEKKEMQEMTGYFATEIYDKSIAASYSFLIRPKVSNFEIFDTISASEVIINKAISFLSNSIELDGLREEYPKHSDFTIGSFKKFLKFVYESKLNVDLTWFSPHSNNTIVQEVDYINANKIINNINSLSLQAEEKFNKTGKFRAINLDTAHFSFVSTEEEEFSGYFDKLLKDGLMLANFVDVYEITIERATIKESGKSKAAIKDVILAYYPVD